jgi:hypothetical protein
MYSPYVTAGYLSLGGEVQELILAQLLNLMADGQTVVAVPGTPYHILWRKSMLDPFAYVRVLLGFKFKGQISDYGSQLARVLRHNGGLFIRAPWPQYALAWRRLLPQPHEPRPSVKAHARGSINFIVFFVGFFFIEI